MAGRPRIVALDHLRGFVIALVVLHHSVLAYCHYAYFDRRHPLLSTAPVVDSARWIGFDVLVLGNDSFFMPLMFLLAGLFVGPSLRRKGEAAYLRDRLLRLGLPFGVAVLTLTPLAYLPSFRLAGDEGGFGTIWASMVFGGGLWPSGPPWFVGVLLLFDAVSAVTFLVWRSAGRAAAFRTSRRPAAARCFGLLVVLSAAGYLPLLGIFGPTRWIAVGPFAVQASRMLLYGTYFAAGITLGREEARDGIVAPNGPLRQGWAAWTVVAGLFFVVLVTLQATHLWMTAGMLPLGSGVMLAGTVLVLFCAAACFALLGVFLRFGGRRGRVWNSLAANAYGIYLLHYPVVTWAQYTLVGAPRLGAIVKAALVFAIAMIASWAGAAGLRRIPAVARVVG